MLGLGVCEVQLVYANGNDVEIVLQYANTLLYDATASVYPKGGAFMKLSEGSLVPATGLIRWLAVLRGQQVLVYRCRYHQIRYRPKPLENFWWSFGVPVTDPQVVVSTLTISLPYLEAMEQMRVDCGLGCICEVLDAAIELLGEVLKVRADGCHLAAVDRVSGTYKLLIMPPILPE